MNAPKLHHYVPQFYLRRFADEQGRLWVWDKEADRVFSTTSGSIAAQTQFYRLTQYESEGHNPYEMERQLSELEGYVSKITDQWLDWLPQMEPEQKLPIPRPNRRLIAIYLAIQILRTVDTRKLLSAMVELDNGARPSKQEDRENHTELMWDPDIVEIYARRFRRSIWMFARNQTATPFITSDNPVAFRSNDNLQWMRSIVMDRDAYLVFPLSPQAILYCFPRRGSARALAKFADCLSPVALDDLMVESENMGQVFMASRFVISNRENFDAERDFAPTIGTDFHAPAGDK